MKASHKDRWTSIRTGRGETEIEIKAGQFIFGRNKAATELKVKPETARKRLEKLKTIGNLTTQPHTHFTVVTICNWGAFQDQQEAKKGREYQPSTNQVPTKYQPSTTDKNVKNEKNVKKTTLPLADGFEEFWVEYPKKVAKKSCLDIWKRKKLGLLKDKLKADVLTRKEKCRKWRDGFIPNPSTYLTGDRWDDEMELAPPTQSQGDQRQLAKELAIKPSTFKQNHMTELSKMLKASEAHDDLTGTNDENANQAISALPGSVSKP
jgi:hypothetical protein